MAVFVDLDEEDVEPPSPDQSHLPNWPRDSLTHSSSSKTKNDAMQEPQASGNPNRNSMTEALGCYPVIMAIASSIDLNTLEHLAQTCRQVRVALLQYRKMLIVSTLHCSKEEVPVDGEETLRYRARARDWFYMDEVGRGSAPYNGKSGQCARDMVSECRRCGTVVCRNCTIKPPAPVVLKGRHRRLCLPCSRAPIGRLVQPPLSPDMPLDSDEVRRGICRCATDGVWLCQPCGRSIRSADSDYFRIWRWRSQYGEVLGGVGTGIGEGDRGVICGRGEECCAAKEREQETDCDAEDARDGMLSASWGSTNQSLSDLVPPSSPDSLRRTPSPQMGPGYARHEIEGIGGVVKTKLVRMVRIGACVPEWEDEKLRKEPLERERNGQVRSWCGWCYRAIPGANDLAADKREEAVLPVR